MRLPAPRLALPAALAAVLAGSGCDYFRNLVGDKPVDKGGLKVLVVDAWTREPIAGARCGGEGMGSLKTDDAGRLEWTGLLTGVRPFECTHSSYRPRSARGDLPASGVDSVLVEMARDSADWYLDDDARKLSIGITGNLRYPGRIRLQATPRRSGDIFRYEWTANGERTGGPGFRDTLWVDLPESPLDSMNLSFSVKVTATLAGETYEVGTRHQAPQALRNKKPILVLKSFTHPNDPDIRVSCGSTQEVIGFSFLAYDPDGDCRSVRVKSTPLSTSLAIDTSLACGVSGALRFPVIPHVGFPDILEKRDNRIVLTAVDDNGESYDTTLTFKTYSNLFPAVRIRQLDIKDKTFQNTPLRFQVLAWDRDFGQLDYLEVDWGNGVMDKRTGFRHDGLDTAERIIPYAYDEPGHYDIKAKVRDGCGDTGTAVLPIDVSANSFPVVQTFEPRPLMGGKFTLRLDITDPDLAGDLDSLKTILVDWGDATTPHIDSTARGKAYQNTLAHEYRSTLPDSAFWIHLSVEDSHGGVVLDTLKITRLQAMGGP